ncbi:MAG: GlxA family transcriptional regulator [Fimbriimonadaceae bacterium]|nr:GlxA family transcriptional regulator [Alphaproteobacteria bacterium]
MAKTTRKIETFGFVLMPEFSLMPVTAAIEPLRLANRCAESNLYRWYMASLDGQPVTASNGMEIKPDCSVENLPETASVIVCGGVNIQKHTDKNILNSMRRRARMGAHIGSMCTGSHVLAAAGLLDGYRCTIHWENLPSLVEEFPEINVTGNLYEVDRSRFTCAGGTAALDMFLALITENHGETLAALVADQIIYSPIRHHSEHQRRSLPARIGTRHPKLKRIIREMEENIEEPVSPTELAKLVDLSPRQIERLFKRYLQRTPKRYYLELRLQKARLLLLQTEMSVINVALSSGFSSPSHFSKCYRAFYGRTPYRERGVSTSLP